MIGRNVKAVTRGRLRRGRPLAGQGTRAAAAPDVAVSYTDLSRAACQSLGRMEQLFVKRRRPHNKRAQPGETICCTFALSPTPSPPLRSRHALPGLWPRSLIRRATLPSSSPLRRVAWPIRWRVWLGRASAQSWGARSSSKIAAAPAATSPRPRSRARRPMATACSSPRPPWPSTRPCAPTRDFQRATSRRSRLSPRARNR